MIFPLLTEHPFFGMEKYRTIFRVELLAVVCLETVNGEKSYKRLEKMGYWHVRDVATDGATKPRRCLEKWRC